MKLTWQGAPIAALALAIAVGLAACGGSSSSPSNGSNYSYLTLPKAAALASPSPSAAPATPSADPTQAPAPPPPPPPPAPTYPMAATSFPLTPVMGVTGTVTIQVLSPSSYTIAVSAAGLAPGSFHAVHLHFGNCPSAGVHITALSGLAANGAGAGSSSTLVRAPYRGDGRFVIVYAGPNPGPLAACAQLAG